MTGRLAGKAAIVTGAGSIGPGWGNGKATAVLFAREGARVLAVDRDEAAAREVVGLIEGEGGEVRPFVADVSEEADVEAMVAACTDWCGTIDVLQNNVGIVIVGGPVETEPADWRRLIEVNLTSMYLTTRHVLPVMVAQGRGAIVNVSSISSSHYVGYPSAAYSASKGAVNALTRNIAVQYAANGIRCNAVLPGLMHTPLVDRGLRDMYGGDDAAAMIAKRDAQIPTGKMGDAWDTAYASLFLASDEAKYVNGHCLVVDGGLTAKFA